ncbi:MAG: winged helix-turn-helix domain-containing protein, partial [Roseomonas sp.]|nr:winged helix-turn-helix domain-containing protein [Roseomonas sp.]
MGEPKGIGQQIVAAIRQRIVSGQDGPGVLLPSTRALAAEWGVSRTTVTAAYEQLIAE